MHTDILYWIMIFKTYNSSCHVCVFVPYIINPAIFIRSGTHGKVVSGQDHSIAYQVWPKRFVHMVNTAQVSLTMPEPRLSIRV